MMEASGMFFPIVVDHKLIIYSLEIDLAYGECEDGRSRWSATQYRRGEKGQSIPSYSRSSKRRYATRAALERALERGRPSFWEAWK
jgi:hypothetical protein